MEIVIFEGELAMGDSKNTTMVFAQDFRVLQCATGTRKLTIETDGVAILGAKEVLEASSHAVYLDHCLVGRMDSDKTELTALPDIEAGAHRVAIHVSTFPGSGLCDDFVLKRVVLHCGP